MSETVTLEKPHEASAANDANQDSNVSKASVDLLDQLLNPEVQQSLTTLVDNLPKLTEMVSVLTKAYDLSQAIITDRVLIEDLTGGLQQFVKPIQEKVKDFTSAAIEANDKAQTDQSTIGLFGLLRMLKDPQMQQMFRFTQAFLDILAERKKQA